MQGSRIGLVDRQPSGPAAIEQQMQCANGQDQGNHRHPGYFRLAGHPARLDGWSNRRCTNSPIAAVATSAPNIWNARHCPAWPSVLLSNASSIRVPIFRAKSSTSLASSDPTSYEQPIHPIWKPAPSTSPGDRCLPNEPMDPPQDPREESCTHDEQSALRVHAKKQIEDGCDGNGLDHMASTRFLPAGQL